MVEKVGRNDPCPCGSGKKYKQCCMKKQTSDGAKYTASGKRKFKAKVIQMGNDALSVFNRSATTPQEGPTESARLERLKFKKTQKDFQVEPEEQEQAEPDTAPEKPQEKEPQKPEDTFKKSDEDFREEK